MIRGVHHIGMNVRDMERMQRFYQEAFGFVPVDDGFSWADEPIMDKIVDVGHVKTLYGYDPEGNVIEVQQVVAKDAGMRLEDLKAVV
jgi:catechol 2,3-dioxygenase-like lactoylglutathione lyase family enzyme